MNVIGILLILFLVFVGIAITGIIIYWIYNFLNDRGSGDFEKRDN